MSVAENTRDMLAREPFESFRLSLSSGESRVLRNPELVVVMKTEVFIARANSDRHTFIPLLHVATVEKLGGTNGNGRSRRRRPRGPR